MTPSKKTEKEFEQSSIFDPFPEPRTVPTGWDLSTYLIDFCLPDGFESAKSTEEQ